MGLKAPKHLLDRQLVPEAPWIQTAAVAELTSRLRDGEQRAAVLAEIEGAAQGRMALLVSDAAREAVQSLVVQRSPERRGPHRASESGQQVRRELMAASALLEMGNVAFSAAANALAEVVGGRVFPSVPRFSSNPVADLAEGWPGSARALLVQFELVGSDDALRVRMIWLPAEEAPG